MRQRIQQEIDGANASDYDAIVLGYALCGMGGGGGGGHTPTPPPPPPLDSRRRPFRGWSYRCPGARLHYLC